MDPMDEFYKKYKESSKEKYYARLMYLESRRDQDESAEREFKKAFHDCFDWPEPGRNIREAFNNASSYNGAWEVERYYAYKEAIEIRDQTRDQTRDRDLRALQRYFVDLRAGR